MKFELPKGRYTITASITWTNGEIETFSRPATPQESQALDAKDAIDLIAPNPDHRTEIESWRDLAQYTGWAKSTLQRLMNWSGFPKPEIEKQPGKRRKAKWNRKKVDDWLNKNSHEIP